MPKAKYPVGSIVKHKTMGYIARVVERDSYCVVLEVLKGDNTNVPWDNKDIDSDTGYEKVRLGYSPNSINRIFEDLGPSASILYGKD